MHFENKVSVEYEKLEEVWYTTQAGFMFCNTVNAINVTIFFLSTIQLVKTQLKLQFAEKLGYFAI